MKEIEELVSYIQLFNIEKCNLSLEQFKSEILSRFSELKKQSGERRQGNDYYTQRV